MDYVPDPSTLPNTRHKCPACFKQYKRKEHLIEHMKVSCHSIHQPKCGVCQKHCKSFESLREHLNGPLAKQNCSKIFADRGCHLCMKTFDDPPTLSEHKWSCSFPPPKPLWGNPQKCQEAVAMDCEMVGGGSDGSLDICARVCLIDADENVLFHTYVQPLIPITDYRSEVTGLTEEHLRDAMPLKEVQEKILTILYNGETIGIVRLNGGKARLLVGHSVKHDLDCLRMNYPDHLIRDTANYRPLMKTNLVSHSLKYLTKTYLGYEIQTGVHDPYEDCVSAMRLYKRMCAHAQDHHAGCPLTPNIQTPLNGEPGPWKMKDLEKMTPDELYEMSRSDYVCWCFDSWQPPQQL
ncbi:hypothetical protein Nepgr_004475 [Nepenthes gracilis]|uniref:RNA exonuclease 4 n=1 Tax=Nepenthes gracilis TaxID=150966 RepID=A0AAD3S1H2_NEPGR|nr:hypothetical protein Nepgr_004475 [Nepenthes gracilis]